VSRLLLHLIDVAWLELRNWLPAILLGKSLRPHHIRMSRQIGRALHSNPGVSSVLVLLLLIFDIVSLVSPAVGQIVVHDLSALPLSLDAAGGLLHLALDKCILLE